MAMNIFLSAQVAEFLGLLRKAIAQSVGKIIINAGVLLLHGNGQGENFYVGSSAF